MQKDINLYYNITNKSVTYSLRNQPVKLETFSC